MKFWKRAKGRTSLLIKEKNEMHMATTPIVLKNVNYNSFPSFSQEETKPNYNNLKKTYERHPTVPL